MTSLAVDPRVRFMAAEMLESAVHSTEYLLRLDRLQRSFDPNLSKTDPLFSERLFEGFESLVWLLSPGSTMYFEALGYDPQYGRERLYLSNHIDVALRVVEEYHSLMITLYEGMGRHVAKQLQRRILSPQLKEYAVKELEASIALLRLLSTRGIVAAGEPVGGEIIGREPVFLQFSLSVQQASLEEEPGGSQFSL